MSRIARGDVTSCVPRRESEADRNREKSAEPHKFCTFEVITSVANEPVRRIFHFTNFQWWIEWSSHSSQKKKTGKCNARWFMLSIACSDTFASFQSIRVLFFVVYSIRAERRYFQLCLINFLSVCRNYGEFAYNSIQQWQRQRQHAYCTNSFVTVQRTVSHSHPFFAFRRFSLLIIHIRSST